MGWGETGYGSEHKTNLWRPQESVVQCTSSWNQGFKRWSFEHEIHSMLREQNEKGNLEVAQQWYDKCSLWVVDNPHNVFF
jgi:hypothetical protein